MGAEKDKEETLFTELVLGLDGERDLQFKTLFQVVEECLEKKDKNGKVVWQEDAEGKKLAFAFAIGVAKAYPEICTGYIEEGNQLSVENGWTLVYRDTDGFSLWYMPDMDLIGLQRAFYQ